MIKLKTKEIKIIDFGCASWLEFAKDGYKCSRGTPEYWPPECFLDHKVTSEGITVWSIGAIFYILLIGQWNFRRPHFIRNIEREETLSHQAYSCIQGTLCPNPEQRAGLFQIFL